MFDSIEHPFDGHTHRRLVDHTQDEMTLEYLSEGFEDLIERTVFSGRLKNLRENPETLRAQSRCTGVEGRQSAQLT
jgi:hypothetical protein